MKCAWTVALLIFAPGAASSQVTSALDLLQACEVIERFAVISGESVRLPNNKQANVCWSYFNAVQHLSVIADNNRVQLLRICAPPESTLLQLVRIFTNYARQNPGELHKQAGVLVTASLWQSFPCRDGQ